MYFRIKSELAHLRLI